MGIGNSSTVTGRTVSDLFHGPDVVQLHQLPPFGRLVITLGRPIHVEDLLARPDVFGGVPMTLQTPFHVQRRDAPGERHLIHTPVAGRTADTFVYVNAVIEINVIWQVVDAGPFNRLAGSEAL